jgi:hypothetical protein
MPSTYANGTPCATVEAPLDQPSLRARLRADALALRPDPLKPLRPGHGRPDALARAKYLLSLRNPDGDDLITCRMALDVAKEPELSQRVWLAVRIPMTASARLRELNEIRRLVAALKVETTTL